MNNLSIRHSVRILFAAGITFALMAPMSALGQELFKFGPLGQSDGGGLFGNAVAIDGGIVIVGERDAGEGAGLVHGFDAVTGNRIYSRGSFEVGTGLDDSFGLSVSMDGGTMIAGSLLDQPALDAGAVHLFDGVTGTYSMDSLADDGAFADLLGLSVGISGGVMIAGAPWDDDLGDKSGAAYLFDVMSGDQLRKLLPDDGAASDEFGMSVGISDDLCIAISRTGTSAYLFDTATGQQLFKLEPDPGTPDDSFEFRQSVAIGGGVAAVGASRDAENGADAGAVYLFDTATGDRLLKLMPDDAEPGDRFGYSVAIDGRRLLVGATGDDDGINNGGSAYLFDVATGKQLQKITPSDLTSIAAFGTSVAIDGDLAVIGAVNQDAGFKGPFGAAYLYVVPGCVAADLNMDSIVDTADLGMLIARFGSADKAADVNGDGVVDTADLGIVISEFGNSCQ